MPEVRYGVDRLNLTCKSSISLSTDVFLGGEPISKTLWYTEDVELGGGFLNEDSLRTLLKGV